jgi:mono/diheme cytochrome c family protein
MRDRRYPKRARGWVLLGLGILGLAICGCFANALYDIPLNTFLPPETIAQGASSGIHPVDPTRFDAPEQAELAQRGQYIFTIACALCHGTNGSGGTKVSWKPFGTLWTRNITPDDATGLGQWSDAEISRAIRSGVSRDGYQLHWQGMIWDHASNWDEEDIRAVVAYLRTLPPVTKKIPADRPPAPDDCDTYTFWTSESTEYGCK